MDLEGHARVSRGHKTADGYRLNQWVGVQRTTKDRISPERRARLESLPGWSWDVLTDMWEEGFRHLKEFVAREGHAKIRQTYRAEDGYRLGTWITVQRGLKDRLPEERKARLEAFPGWTWDVLAEMWEEGFHHLLEFADREGHTRVVQSYITTDKFRLGTWVAHQRGSKESMPPRYRARLEALPGWSWDALSDKWENGFRHLKEFADCEGHSLVPAAYKSADGFRIGGWVNSQRTRRANMPAERRARLESLPGWSWALRSKKGDRK